MKKIFFPLLLCLLSFACLSQTCELTGLISSKDREPLNLILLSADGHYSLPEILLAPAGEKKFRKTIELRHPIFAILRYGDQRQRVLLSPGRDLHVLLNADAPSPVSYSGKAAEENRLILNSILDSIPFFTKDGSSENPYAKLPASEWPQKIMKPIEKELSAANREIDQSRIPEELKLLLKSETRFVYQCHLHDFTNNILSWAGNPERDQLLDQVMHWIPQPDSTDLVSGFYANMMISKWIHYETNKLARGAKGNKEKMQETISSFFRIPFDTIDSLIRKYGERYMLAWFYGKDHLPGSVMDKVLFNTIIDAISNINLSTAFLLADTLQYYYPGSPHIAAVQHELDRTTKQLAANRNNPMIQFRQPNSIHSIEELVKPYAGKIVYLDIWGTWCGPCRIEMKFAAALKEKFRGKDIVFLYLDMDDDAKEETWKEYLYYTRLEGEHYRMNQQEIQPIWSEIKAAGGRTGYYPTYLLFDRNGKLITTDAERPSSKEKLYAQLEQVL